MQQFKLVALLFVCLVAFAQKAAAQATLSVQGTIQKSTGVAVDDGDYAITFRLYDQASGGTLIWSETQDPVEIIGGVYSVTLGSVNPLTAPFDQTYYLGISVGGGAEHTPRSTLTSAPYALSLLGQDNKFPSTGNVGIGTTAPTTSLDANGSISTATVTTSAASYTVAAADHVIFLDLAGAQSVTLPSAATFPRREIVLINKTSTAKTVSSYVDLAGTAATAIPANGMIELRSNGTEWRLATTFAPPAAAAEKAFVLCHPASGQTGMPANGTNFTIAYTESSDAQNCFANNTFTAPRTGIYHFSGFNGIFPALNVTQLSYGIVSGGTAGGNLRRFNKTIWPQVAPDYAVNFSFSLAMTAGQTATINFFASSNPTTTVTVSDGSIAGFLTITEN